MKGSENEMINLDIFLKEYEQQMKRKTTAVTIQPKVTQRKCNCIKCRPVKGGNKECMKLDIMYY